MARPLRLDLRLNILRCDRILHESAVSFSRRPEAAYKTFVPTKILVRATRSHFQKAKLRLGFAFQRRGSMPKSPDPTDKHVGTRVRMRRLMLGLSQTKLADALGLTFQQVQKYEKGVNRISASSLQQISAVLRRQSRSFSKASQDRQTNRPTTMAPSLRVMSFSLSPPLTAYLSPNHSCKSKAQSFGTALSASPRN